jgi:Yip1 domain
MQTAASGSIIERMMGVARLDVATYESIEHDTNATTQAAIVVVLAAIASGIGALGDGATGFFAGIIGGILGWIVFAAATYLVGTKLLATAATEADLGQLLRTVGFAYTPNLLNVLGWVPVLGAILAFVAGIWVIVTTVIAVRQALEMSTLRAIATAIIAAILAGIVLAIVFAIFGVSMPGT